MLRVRGKKQLLVALKTSSFNLACIATLGAILVHIVALLARILIKRTTSVSNCHELELAEVLWYRDTMQLDTTERRIMESRGSRHTLVIRKVNRQDFGNYTCVADNQLGKTRKSIQLTGKPHPAKFNSPTTGKWKENYNISWEVESLSPVEEYKLLYRRLPDIVVVTSDNQPQPLHHQSLKKVFPKGDNKTFSANGYVYSRPIKDRRLDWRDVILPAIPAQPVGMQSMSYVIRGLEPGQQYEARVQARNKFGWSPVSDAFNFKTTDTENAIEDVQSVRSYSSDAISHLRANLSFLLLVLNIPVRLFLYT